MNTKLLLLSLLLTISGVYAKSNYTAVEMQHLIKFKNSPKTFSPKLMEVSIGEKSFEECKSMLIGVIDMNKPYPSVIYRDSFGVFRAHLWSSNALYEFNCIEINNDVLFEKYRSVYK